MFDRRNKWLDLGLTWSKPNLKFKQDLLILHGAKGSAVSNSLLAQTSFLLEETATS